MPIDYSSDKYKARLANMLFAPNAIKTICFEIDSQKVEGTRALNLNPYLLYQSNMEQEVSEFFGDVEPVKDNVENRHAQLMLTMSILDNGDALNMKWIQDLINIEKPVVFKSVSGVFLELLRDIRLGLTPERDIKDIGFSDLPGYRMRLNNNCTLNGGIYSMMRMELLRGKWILLWHTDCNGTSRMAILRVLGDAGIKAFMEQLKATIDMLKDSKSDVALRLIETLESAAMFHLADEVIGVWREANGWSWYKVYDFNIEETMNDVEEDKIETSTQPLMVLVRKAIEAGLPVRETWEKLLMSVDRPRGREG